LIGEFVDLSVCHLSISRFVELPIDAAGVGPITQSANQSTNQEIDKSTNDITHS